MAIELEQEIMKKIGLGSHYNYFNGSGSCRYVRKRSIELLPDVLQKYGMSLNEHFKIMLNEANIADEIGNQEYRLTNVWIIASYAIQDAIYRKNGNKGFIIDKNYQFYFFDDKERERYYLLKNRQNTLHKEFKK